MTLHRILNTDSRDLRPFADRSVELVVTSPPYPMIAMWDGVFSRLDPEIGEDLAAGRGMAAFDKMHAVLDAVWTECARVLTDGGFACINIGDAVRTIGGPFRLFPNHAAVIESFTRLGFSVLPDILWRKPSNAPTKFMGSGMYPAGAYVTYEHEYILIFRKGGKRPFTGEARKRRQKSACFWEERNIWYSDLWDIRGTSQDLFAAGTDGTNARERNASFPFEVPHRLVNMYSIEGDTVLDPFCGLGTTGLACMVANRNSIGAEIDPAMAALALRGLQVSPDALNRILEGRLSAHRRFIETLPPEIRERCYENRHHGIKVRTRQETEIHLDEIASVTFADGAVECH